MNPSRDVRVLSVASEIYPVIKTGGLADVVGALPRALAAENVSMRMLVPGYPAVLRALESSETVASVPDLFGDAARVVAGTASDLDLLVIDAPHLFAREGNPYLGPDGNDWPDNAFRFAALGRIAADIGRGSLEGYEPDVVHAHDWQAGLAPAYLSYAAGRRPATIATVHNLAFQGRFPPALLAELGLPSQAYATSALEYYGTISFLKAALVFADRITTVSPTYASEIATAEAGMGLDGVIRERAAVVSGILNGIDDAVWDPSTDDLITARYDVGSVAKRAANTRALRARLGLELEADGPLIGVVSRLSSQKGLDVLLAALPRLLASGAQLALLGDGDVALADAFRAATRANLGRVAAVIGYDESLAHFFQAGADALVVPSRFEPCGLTQLCALRYGAVPIVSRVGGLADTVIDANEMALAAGVATGIVFAPVEQSALETALARATALFPDRDAWTRMQTNGMQADVSWRSPAKRYARLYRDAIAARPAP